MPDTGTTMVLGLIVISMISIDPLSSSLQRWFSISFITIFILAIIMIVFFPEQITKLVTTSKFQSGRIVTFLDPFKTVRNEGSKPIISHHNYSSMPLPHSLSKILKAEIEAGAEVCKIIGTARNHQDNFIPLKLLSEASDTINIIAFCMGKYGIASRVLAPIFGATFTYASISHGNESASGQLTVRAMKRIYKLLQ